MFQILVIFYVKTAILPEKLKSCQAPPPTFENLVVGSTAPSLLSRKGEGAHYGAEESENPSDCKMEVVIIYKIWKLSNKKALHLE